MTTKTNSIQLFNHYKNTTAHNITQTFKSSLQNLNKDFNEHLIKIL